MDQRVSESQQLLASAQVSEALTDKTGRQIEVRQPSRRDTLRYMRQWGVACNVEAWMATALLTVSVLSIDGVPMPKAQTAEQVEALADMLGDAGMEAVGEWYMKLPGVDPGKMRNDAKN